MEFFKIVDVAVSEKDIQESIICENIEKFSNNLFGIGKANEFSLPIGSIWGEFTLLRNKIKGGVRFALQECPNALAWTVTTGYPPKRDAVVIHLTINRERKDQGFLDEIEEFLQDHSICINDYFI